jgi:hypothetical protein
MRKKAGTVQAPSAGATPTRRVGAAASERQPGDQQDRRRSDHDRLDHLPDRVADEQMRAIASMISRTSAAGEARARHGESNLRRLDDRRCAWCRTRLASLPFAGPRCRVGHLAPWLTVTVAPGPDRLGRPAPARLCQVNSM